MPSTVISPLVHSPEEHDIVAMPDAETVQKIVAVQKQLQLVLGDAIWLTPPNTLHCTLMEIICNAEYTGLSRKEHFRHWYERYNDTAKEVIAQFGPIEATFNELYVSPAAIILKAADPGPFNAIRTALLARIVLPEQTKMPPGIAHCTIARYNKVIDLDNAREQTRPIVVNFDTSISEFKLMKDLGPDFHPIVEDVYTLNNLPE